MHQESDEELAKRLQEEEESIANDTLIATYLEEELNHQHPSHDVHEDEDDSRENHLRINAHHFHAGRIPSDDSLDLTEDGATASNRVNTRSTSGRRRPEANSSAFNVRSFRERRENRGFHPFTNHRRRNGRERESVGDDYEELWDLAEQLGDVANKGLDESEIEISALPISRYVRRDSTSEQDTQDIMECSECRICLSQFEENERLRTLPCLHRFHLGCIDPWIKSNGVCPVCRIHIKDQLNHELS